jgi:hypothetical protein
MYSVRWRASEKQTYHRPAAPRVVVQRANFATVDVFVVKKKEQGSFSILLTTWDV